MHLTHEPEQFPTESPVISLRLVTYDDIFSDFDIRPFSHRALSVDFMDEVRRAARDKREGGIELELFMPEKDRNEARELVIKERLTAHFKKHFHLLLHERKHVLRFGIWMVVTGVLCMLAAAAVMFKDPSHNLLLSFLVVFLEPAAWFLLWEGMDQIIFESKKLNGEVDFYRKMSHKEGHIVFKSY